jgi:hypothetical protein
MPDAFDLEIERLSDPSVRKERLRREQAERQRRTEGKPPDLDPTPLAERELVGDDGVTRLYRTTDVEAGIRRSLEEMHRVWTQAGSPEDGPLAG